MNINDQDYENISPTAFITSYPRIYTDIPYEKEIFKYLESHLPDNITLNKDLAPEIEARYKLINNLLNKSNIKQVVELASGYSSRGIIYSKNNYNYIEVDLSQVIKTKKELINNLFGSLSSNHYLINGNVLRKEVFVDIDRHLNKDEPVCIINEGLLRYLSFNEKKLVAKNIYNLLSTHGGIWITSDVTPKKFIASQEKAIKDFNNKLTNMTSRNKINNRFNDINYVKAFFGDLGFNLVEVHKFNEVKNELYSVNNLNIINNNIDKTLEYAIVVIMAIKKEN